MRRIFDFFCPRAPLAGLEDILAQVASGDLSQDAAAQQIRELASKPYIPRWFLRLFRLVGAVFVIVGVAFAGYSVLFSIGAREVPGIVIEMVGDHAKSPIVEYNVDGRRFTYHSSLSASPPAYFVGEQVSLLYRPDNPARAQINSFTDRWLFPVAFTGGGIVGVLVSFLWPRVFSVITGRGSGRTP